MGNELKLALLAMLDVEGSAAEMAKQFPQLHDKLKELAIKIKIDTGSLEAFKQQLRDLQKVQQEIESKRFVGQPTASGQMAPTTNLAGPANDYKQLNELTTALQEKFVGVRAVVNQFSTDLESGMSKASVSVQNTDGVMQKFKITYDHLSGQLFGAGDKEATLFVNTNKAVREATSTITGLQAQMKRMYADQKTYGESEERTIKIQSLNNAVMKESARATGELNNLRQNGLISKEVELKLLSQVVEAQDKYNASQNTLQNKSAKSQVQAAATQALKEYKTLYLELLELEKRQQAGTIKSAESERKTKDLKEQMVLQTALVGLSEKQAILQREFIQGQERSKQAKEGSAAVKEEIALVTALATQYNKKYEAQEKALTARGNVDPKGEEKQLLLVEKINAEITKLQQKLDEKKANGLLPTTEQQLTNISLEAKKAEESLARLAVTASNKRSSAIDQQMGKVVTKTKAGVDVGILSSEDATNNARVAQHISALQGEEVQIKKNISVKNNYNEITRQITVTSGQHNSMLKDSVYYYDAVTGAVRLQGESLRLNANRMLGWSEQVSIAIKRMAQWAVAGTLIYGTLRKIKEGMGFMRQLDKDLTDIAIIQGMSRKDIQGLAKDYSELAVTLNRSMKEISGVYTELVRQGLSLEETENRMKTILKLSSAGAVSVSESMKIVTASVNAMEVSHERAADVLLKAANISASDVGQLGEAFTKVASSAYSAGVSIEQTTALIAGMIQTTQEGPSQIGTSLKTIIARFNQINEETGEFNQDLNKVQTAIESVGVSFVNSSGQIRNVYSILKDLSGVWKNLDKNQQAYIATTAAGVRMQNRFFAIMNSFEEIDSIQQDLVASAGTLDEAYEISLTGVEASANRATVALENVWFGSIQPDALIFLNDAKTSLLQVVEKLGALNLILGIVTFSLITSSTAFKAWTASAILTPAILTKIVAAFNAAYTEGLILNQGIKSWGVTWAGLKGAMQTLIPTLQSSVILFQQIAIAAGAAIAITVLVKVITDFVKKQKEASEAVRDANNAFLTFNSTLKQTTLNVSSGVKELALLQREFATYGGKLSAPIEKQQRYNEVLAELAPVFKDVMDEGENFEDFVDRIGIGNLSKTLSEQAEQVRKAAADGLPQALKEYNTAVKKEQTSMAKPGMEPKLDTTEMKKAISISLRAAFEGMSDYNDLTDAERTAIIKIIPQIELTTPDLKPEELIAMVEDIKTSLKNMKFDEKIQLGDKLFESLQAGTIDRTQYDREIAALVNEMRESFEENATSLSESAYEAGANMLTSYTLGMSEAANALDPMLMNFETLVGVGERTQTQQMMVNSAFDEFNRMGKLSIETIKEIIAEYPEYTNLLYANDAQTEESLTLLREKIALEQQAYTGQIQNKITSIEKEIAANEKLIDSTVRNKAGAAALDAAYAKRLSLTGELVDAKNRLITANKALTDSEAEHLDALGDSKSKIDDYTKFMEEFGEQGAFSYETIMDMMEKYSGELGGLMNDHEALYNYIAELAVAEQKIHEEKFKAMLMNNEAYFKTVVANNAEYFRKIQEYAKLDVEGFANAAHAKAEIEAALLRVLGENWSLYYSKTTKALTTTGKVVKDMMGRIGLQDQPFAKALGDIEKVDNAFAGFAKDIKMPDFSKTFKGAKAAGSAAKGAAKDTKEFSQELDLLAIKMGALDRQIVALETALSSAFSIDKKKDLFTQLVSFYKEKKKLLNDAMYDYQQALDREMSKVSEKLQNQIKYGGLTVELITDEETGKTVNRILEIKAALESTQDEMRQTKDTLTETFGERLANMTSGGTLAMEEFNHQLGLIDDTAENFAIRNELMASGLVILEAETKSVEQAFALLHAELEKGTITQDQYLKLEQQLIAEKRRIQNEIRSIEQQRRQEAERLADNHINALKKQYETQKKVALDAIKDRMTAEEKAHQRRIKMLDEELKRYNDVIDAKLQQLDRGEDQRTYEMELAELQEERAKMQENINILQLDDSLEAQNKILAMTKDLDAQDKKISEFQHKRNIDLRKENLNDLKDKKNKEIEAIKTTEQEKADLFKEAREAEQKMAEEHWDQLLNNEAQFNTMRENLIAQHLGATKDLHDKFLNDWVSDQTSAYGKLAQMLRDLQSQQAQLGGIDQTYTTGTPAGKNPAGENLFPVNGGTPGNTSFETKAQIIARQRARWERYQAEKNEQRMADVLSETRNAIGDQSFKFLKGGETNSTGLHWLDGTHNKPERILSAEQTRMFGKLVDWLPSFGPAVNTAQVKQSGGDVHIDTLLRIDGNVDKQTMPQLKTLVDQAVQQIHEIQKRNFTKNGLVRGV